MSLLISSNENITVKIGEYEIQNSECEELRGVKLDWKLNCDDHISNRCKKARGELNALVRIAPFIGLSKRRILITPVLILNLVIVPLFGCATAAQIIGK